MLKRKNDLWKMFFVFFISLLVLGCTVSEEELYEYHDEEEEDPYVLPTYTSEETNKNQIQGEWVTIGSWWYTDYTSVAFKETLVILHGMGVEGIFLTVTEYIDDLDDPTIEPIMPKTPDILALRSAISDCKQMGFKVCLRPVVDVFLTGEWRGFIDFSSDPVNNSQWWESYETFITKYADLSQEFGLELFLVGLELKALITRSEWSSMIIPSVRNAFDSELVYAANHDSYQEVIFWEDLDYIGIDAYFSLAGTEGSVAQMSAAYAVIASGIQSYAATKGMDVIFTEFGIQSRPNAYLSPWWIDGTEDADGLQQQADVYDAFFGEFHNVPWVKAIAAYMQYFDSQQDPDDFSIISKPAGAVLEYYFRIEG